MTFPAHHVQLQCVFRRFFILFLQRFCHPGTFTVTASSDSCITVAIFELLLLGQITRNNKSDNVIRQT